MILIACVDDRMGMMFNRRRLSRDAVLCQNVLTLCGEAGLTVSPYTAKLFAEFPDAPVRTQEGVFSGDGAYFAEDPAQIPPDGEGVTRLVLYRWNRKYPADRYFPFPLTGWALTETTEFAGKSHETITREIYERNTEGGCESCEQK